MSSISFSSVATFVNQFARSLARQADSEEARAIARLVLEEVSGKPLSRLMTERDLQLDDRQKLRIVQALRRLRNNEPIQYVLGFAHFAGHRFVVRPGVLIPRGETEELVEWVASDLTDAGMSTGQGLRILDIGCGSGCLGISLALRLTDAAVVCLDHAPEPLAVTRENNHLLQAGVTVVQQDILHPDPGYPEETFSIIISNPPYVMPIQKEQMQANVLSYEPEEALFVPKTDPLLFYRAIGDYAQQHLEPGGVVYLEINEVLGEETKTLLESYFAEVELRQDIHAKNRMIKAYGRKG